MDSGELLILKQGRGNYFTGISAILIGIFLILIGASWTTENLVAFLIFWVIAVPVMAMGIYLIIYTIRYKITVDGEKVICNGTFGNITELNWKDVVRISYNLRINQLVLGDGHHKIKIDTKMAGYNDFLGIMKSKVDPSIYQEDIPSKI